MLYTLRLYTYSFLMLLTFQSVVNGQSAVPFLKAQTDILAGPAMLGRGYVDGGGDSAARYINDQFRLYGLEQFSVRSDFYQPYSFPVNSFPGVVSLKINNKQLEPGKDFLVHAASTGAEFNNKRVKHINLSKVKDSLSWQRICKGFKENKVYFLVGIDTVMKYNKLGIRSLAKSFTRTGTFIISTKQKLTWLATTDTVPATILFVQDSVLPKGIQRASVNVENKFIPNFRTQNVLGFVPGTQYPDSFMVFTAHYDHLGEMGKGVIFSGANDNASGTSVLLYLARYYATNPAKYSVAFMAFSGEEAGLVGSSYYVTYPRFPLKQIRFLVNLDMAGDATKGITVVNAAGVAKEFSLLQRLQKTHSYLPSITPRVQTRNSDHFPFAEKGVPAVYIYTNGIKPHYHDLKDKPEEVNFEQVDGLLHLLKGFVQEL